MSTFCAEGDATLIALIQDARKRIVFIAPGVHAPVATALGKRFREIIWQVIFQRLHLTAAPLSCQARAHHHASTQA